MSNFHRKKKSKCEEKGFEKEVQDLLHNSRSKSLPTLAILIQNGDVVKSETSFRISATLNWTFSQHAD